MDAFIFRFTAAQLSKIPSRYLGFLIASGHCCNELAVLLPYIIFEHDLRSANEVESAFILARRFTVARIVISKVIEYGNLCSEFIKSFDKPEDELFRELQAAYVPIATELNGAKWARILRNKISFHYDKEHALDSLRKLEHSHPLRVIAGRIKGQTLFEFSEEIVSRPIFETAGGGDIGKGMDTANKFVVRLVGSITQFHAQTTLSVFRAYEMISEREKGELRGTYCANPEKFRVPISISSAYLKAHKGKRGVGKGV